MYMAVFEAWVTDETTVSSHKGGTYLHGNPKVDPVEQPQGNGRPFGGFFKTQKYAQVKLDPFPKNKDEHSKKCLSCHHPAWIFRCKLLVSGRVTIIVLRKNKAGYFVGGNGVHGIVGDLGLAICI